MNRRFLFIAPVFLLAKTGPARASLPAPLESRRLTLRHAATGAVFSGPYHNGRIADPVAIAELSAVLADTRTGETRLFDLGVIDIVWDMGRRQRMAEFTVLSGYRTPETNRAVHGAGDSQHLRAAAMDLQIPAKSFKDFSEAALKLRRGGVGLYPDHGFIHLDSGPPRQWGPDDVQSIAGTTGPVRRASAVPPTPPAPHLSNRGAGWPVQDKPVKESR